MTTLHERRGAGIHIVSEGNGSISREEIVIAEGADLVLTATILGKVTATGKYAPLDLEAADGTEEAAAILWGEVDATDADVRAAVHVRFCEVLKSELVYPTGATENEKTAIDSELADLGIIVR